MAKLKNTSLAFFTLLKAGLWPETEKQVAVDCAVDWEEVYQMATEQSVLGLVLAGIDCLPNDQRPPKVMLLQWIGEIQMLEQQNIAMNHFIGEMVEDLRASGINTLLVKGQGIAQNYVKPLWRSSGDIDFLLDSHNYESAKLHLLPVATSSEKEGTYGKHLGMSIESWTVELHGTQRFGLSKRIDKEMDVLHRESFVKKTARIWKNEVTDVYLLGIDNDIIYVFVHFLKHFYKGGVGLRQICDWIRLIWVNSSEINLSLLEFRLKKMGLLTEWRAFAAYAVLYLEMPPPKMPLYSTGKKWKKKANRIHSFIIIAGDYGQNRDWNYFSKYPYLIRKTISFCKRTGDIFSHALIFPIGSLRLFPGIIHNGIRSALKGE